MAFTMQCSQGIAIITPYQQHKFNLTVLDEKHLPVSGLALEVNLSAREEVKLLSTDIKTNDQGIAVIALQSGSVPEKATIKAQAHGALWEGTLYVTDVDIECPLKLQLREVDESLIKMAYWNKTKLRILREFGGGLSGSRVLQVQAKDEQGLFLTQVVKIGPKDEMHHERGSYQKYFEKRLPSAAPVSEYVYLDRYAAIVYGDATAAKSLNPVKPFADYFIEAESFEISPCLYAVLNRGLRQVYRYFQVKNESFRKLLGKFLPENLVVSLNGGTAQFGVFHTNADLGLDKETRILSEHDVERFNFELADKQTVVLKNFTISKMQDGDLNLEDKSRELFKVKVRYDGVDVKDFSTGNNATIVAQYITDRDSRINFAISDCLNKYGFTQNNYGYALSLENYPDPVELLDSVLDSSCDIAWGTIHGDLHWDNIMLEGPSNWWLIDYGLTGKGPILFDFIKLELYLRIRVLSKLTDITPEMLLEFEQHLMDNPVGEIPLSKIKNTQLLKAVVAIQNIRRLARPYIVGDFYDYYKMVFIYAVALSKYYPTKDKWQAAEANDDKMKKLNKSVQQFFTALAPALAIGRVLKWQKISEKKQAIKFDFVPHGSLIMPVKQKIVLDVGSRCEPGVIDHHFLHKQSGAKAEEKNEEMNSTTSLVWKRPDLITDHIEGESLENITWCVHEEPDFDCIASAYLGWYKAKLGYFPPGAAQLSHYSINVDAGAAFLETVRLPERTPYALFEFYVNNIASFSPSANNFQKRMEAGFEMMTYFSDLELTGFHALIKNIVPQDHGFWKAAVDIGQDLEIFKNQDERLGQKISAIIHVDGKPKKVPGLILSAPKSRFFKAWTRKAGYVVMVVLWPQPNKPNDRIVISVPPSLKQALKGLGAALEKEESGKRKKMKKKRPAEPRRWPDVNNSDPWYDGRSPVHAYTIVDSPREGTVLSVDEVMRILQKGKWVK